MKIVEATEIVLDLATQQWGLVTSAQAGAEGVSPVMLSRLVDKAILTRIRSGVYAAEATPWSSATNIRAQWLALEPKIMAADRALDNPLAVVSHESAAELHGIGDLDSNGIHFTVATRRQTRQPEVVFHVDTLESKDWEMLDGLPVTTPVRTVLDLANAGHEPDHLVDMIGDILHERLATRNEIVDSLTGSTDRFGNKDELESWLDQRFPPSATPAEQMLRQQVDAAWAPVREEMRAWVEQMAPSVKMMAFAEEMLRTSKFHTEVNTELPEAFQSKEWTSMEAKILERYGTFPELSESWASMGSELGKPPATPHQPEDQQSSEDDDETEDQDE